MEVAHGQHHSLLGHGPGEEGAWKAVVAITRGGMAPAMIVARELDIRTVDTISVMSYHSGGGKADQRREAQVLKSPNDEMMGDGTGVLIVDDLVDSGKTLELVRQRYPKAHFATVYAKPKGRPMVEKHLGLMIELLERAPKEST